MIQWWNRHWIVYDLETTHVEPEQAHVVQCGVVVFNPGEGRVLKRYDLLVNPGVPIPAEATAIHGITDYRVKDAMPETQCIARLLALVEWCGHRPDCAFVTYNGFGYDDKVLDALSGGAWSKALDGFPRVDVLTLVRMDKIGRWWKGSGRHKLSAVAGRLGVKLDDEDRLHDASSDCVLTVNVLAALLKDSTFGKELRKLPPGPEVTAFLFEQAAKHEKDFQSWLAKQPPRERP